MLMTQFIALGLAWNLWADPTRTVAALLAVVAVVVIAGVVHPASMAALDEAEV